MSRLKNKKIVVFSLALFLFLGLFQLAHANVEILRPNAAGAYTNITTQYPSSGAHWDKVDEVTHDSSATYISTSSTVQQKDAYNLSDTSIPTGSTINSVTVYFVFRSFSYGVQAYAQPFLRRGTSETAGTIQSTILSGYAIYSQTLARPGGGSWAISDLNGLQVAIGLRAVNAIYPTPCTQVYVAVDYTPVVVTKVIKYIGETATITTTCSDSDGNLSSCSVASPCSKNCSASGSSGSCSCAYTCVTVGTYNACGSATDTGGLTGIKCVSAALECRQSPVNRPPTATNLYRDNCDWCIHPFQFNLNWTFSDPDGDAQYAKWIQVDDNSSFTSIDHDSGKVENNAIPAYTTFLTDGKGGVLQFNKTYYWRLKVWDSKGGESSWLTGSQTLITPKHAYPDPDFTFEPSRPRELQTVQFTDQSFSPVSIARWSWTFQDGNPPTSTLQNPTNIFETPGNKNVVLTVWDSDNYSCSGGKGAQVVPVGIFAPVWREIIPW